MNILVLYHSFGETRRTVLDHLYSFKKYTRWNRFTYVDVVDASSLTDTICSRKYDAVIFHYTFLAMRFAPENFDNLYNSIKDKLQNLSGVKVLIPHDEYVNPEAMCRIINDCDVRRVYTNLIEEADALYPPEKIGYRKDLFRSVYTGYVDEKLLKKINRKFSKQNNEDRPIDVGYRSTQSSYVFGMFGQMKVKINEAFHEAAKDFPNLVEDVSLTNLDNNNNTKLGDDWFSFLMSCRTALGTLSGSSLLDTDGSLYVDTYKYVSDHKWQVTDEEIIENCYKGQDQKIKTFFLGPRYFEYAMAGTCPLFLEGNYGEKIKPGEHYIEIKKDFSNMRDVLKQVEDKKRCAQIAEQYRETVLGASNSTYRYFANYVISDIRRLKSMANSGVVDAAFGKEE